MATANVRGVNINYEVVGDGGPWVTLSPGGRRAASEVRPLAEQIAGTGYRVLLADRRNCGASAFSIDTSASESEIWADDLYELLKQLDALPAFVGGASSGCRMSIQMALRHPEAVRGLLLWRVTGGEYAAKQLSEQYYGQFIKVAQQGGMEAVCASEHFAAMIRENSINRDRLMGMGSERFISGMEEWKKQFMDSASGDVIGASEDELRNGLTVPLVIVPGHDEVHPAVAGQKLHEFVSHSELYDPATEESIRARKDAVTGFYVHPDDELLPIFTQFMEKVSAVRA